MSFHSTGSPGSAVTDVPGMPQDAHGKRFNGDMPGARCKACPVPFPALFGARLSLCLSEGGFALEDAAESSLAWWDMVGRDWEYSVRPHQPAGRAELGQVPGYQPYSSKEDSQVLHRIAPGVSPRLGPPHTSEAPQGPPYPAWLPYSCRGCRLMGFSLFLPVENTTHCEFAYLRDLLIRLVGLCPVPVAFGHQVASKERGEPGPA